MKYPEGYENSQGGTGLSDFDWGRHQPAEVLEEARAPRFRVEMRPLLLGYLGMTPGMHVLEVCCGPGTLAPYLAGGIAPGRAVGLDLDARFIERARAKAAQAAVTNVEYVVGDAYALPFPDNAFDAVTSYTGIGVLNDPVPAVREMIRVCRPGGTVSVMEAIAAASVSGSLEEAPAVELYPGAAEYLALSRRLQRLVREVLVPQQKIGSRPWPVQALFGLLGQMGLESVRVDAWGYGQSPDDARVPAETRQAKRTAEYKQDLAWLESLRGSETGALLAEHGFTPADAERLIELTAIRFQHSLATPFYEWTVGVSLVMAGRKKG